MKNFQQIFLLALLYNNESLNLVIFVMNRNHLQNFGLLELMPIGVKYEVSLTPTKLVGVNACFVETMDSMSIGRLQGPKNLRKKSAIVPGYGQICLLESQLIGGSDSADIF